MLPDGPFVEWAAPVEVVPKVYYSRITCSRIEDFNKLTNELILFSIDKRFDTVTRYRHDGLIHGEKKRRGKRAFPKKIKKGKHKQRMIIRYVNNNNTFYSFSQLPCCLFLGNNLLKGRVGHESKADGTSGQLLVGSGEGVDLFVYKY